MKNDMILALLFVGLPVLAFALWAGAAHFRQWVAQEREKAWKEGYARRRAEDRLADYIKPAVVRVNFEELRAEHIVTWEELQRFGEAAMLDHARAEVQHELYRAASHYMKIYENDDPRRMGKRVMGI
jgi:hypothetical protein